MKRLTMEYINIKYGRYLLRKCYGKNRFGWYSVTLKNGRVIIGNTLKELEESILREIN
jgi:hypothetical protein